MSKERPPLETMTLRQLRKVASEYGISRYSRMRKSQLLEAIEEIESQKFGTPNPSRALEAQEEVEVAKFSLAGQNYQIADSLSSVDEGLADLPGGYGESQIVMMSRDPESAYTYWDVSNEQKEMFRRQGGQQLALRIYDVTDIDLDSQSPHSIQEYPRDELAREWYLPIPVSDRDYVVEIGYRCVDGRWLELARSAATRIPPVYPTEWIDDQFITVSWEEELKGKTFYEFPVPKKSYVLAGVHSDVFGLSKEAESKRIAGSFFGSMHQVVKPEKAVSSFIFPSGVGMWASGVGEVQSGVGLGYTQSGVGQTQSGIGLSGVGLGIGYTQSGIGYTQSGVGYTESGAGLGYTQSGIGLSGVGLGIGYTQSGIGYTQSGVGYTESGAGLGYTQSGIGLSGVGLGIGYTQSGIGYTQSGVGYTESGAGLGYTQSGVGYTQSGIGYTQSGVGYTESGAGLGYTQSGVGYTQSGIGYTQSGVGYTESGAGLGYTQSGVGYTQSGIGYTQSGVGYTESGAGFGYTMSGMGMSGIGMGASMPPIRPRDFWLVADAELIVYGATEPSANLTIGGRPIKLNSDGTFRLQMSFQDGLLDFPIFAVAADGEQTRSVHLKFVRETPERRTNTKEEAIPEWIH